MNDRPYFMQSAKSSGRYATQDFRVVFYLVDLFNDPDPMNVLKWKDAVIITKQDEQLVGNAYIQPLDLRNEYVKGNKAYVHFHDGEDFKLLTHLSLTVL